EDGTRELHADGRARAEGVADLLCRRRGGVEAVVEEVRAIIDFVTETRRPDIGAVREAAELRVAAANEVEAERAAEREPVAGTPLRARRADESLDVLVGLDLVDVARRRGAPTVQRVAIRVQIVLEARSTVDVRRDAEHTGVVALGKPQILLDISS